MHRLRIQNSLDYIEAHLKSDITAQELADDAGFSLYHFYRVFHMYTGMPVMQYVLRRRLVHAAFAIRTGEKNIDAALEYGFDTYAGFYKAFRRELGCTPSEYVSRNRAKQPGRIDLLQETNMEMMHASAKEALKQWGMENESVTDFYYESSGQKADNMVCVGEKYLLKRSRDRDALQNSLLIAVKMERAGAAAQTPVETPDKNQIVQMGEWYFCLCRRPEGKQEMAEEMYGADSAGKARFVGEIIGQFHLILQNAQTSVNHADLLATVRDWALPKSKDILRLSDSFCHNFLSAFERLYPQLPRQVIHRNLNPGSILTNADGWGMIDLEMAERNARIFDPCYAATAVLSESFDESDDEKLQEWIGIYQNILQGYDNVGGMTAQEKEAAPYMVLANQFICVAWFEQQKRYPEVYETNRQMTKWLISHLDALKMV